MHEAAVRIAEVHAIAFAVAPECAVGALSGLHPLVVTVWLEFTLPHFPEVIFVDVALSVVGANARA